MPGRSPSTQCWVRDTDRVLLMLTVAWAVTFHVAGATNNTNWNQWHGPDRNGTTPESSGWPHGWPPKEVWRTNCGAGVSAPIIVKDRVYTMGWKEGEDCVYCLDATGESGKPRAIWAKSYTCPPYSKKGTRFPNSYKSPLATPAMDTSTGYLYTLSCDGDLRCWEAYNPSEPGKLKWALTFSAITV
jgi:hypothetical protein